MVPEFIRGFGFPVSLSPPFRYFQLNLTSDDTAIYHPHRWGEAKSVLERSFSRPTRNEIFS
jgi:hypothetical protein